MTAATAPTALSIDKTQRIRNLFEPAGIAIIGASQAPQKWGFRFMHNLTNGGYKGELYGVNPGLKEVLGRPVFPSISELPDCVELAYIVVPPPAVPKALQQCADRGIKTVIIITAGFGELDDAETRQAQRDITAIGRKEEMVVVGPNCAGVVSPEPMSLAGAMFSWEVPRPGGLSIVSQSGNVGGSILGWSRLHQMGVARVVSSGNEAVTTTEDFLHFYADDDRTKVIFTYIEGVPDGRLLFEALQYASQRKPVVVMKGGRNPAGVRATESHTGSLAAPMNLLRAACRQAGAILVHDLYEAAELCAALMDQPLPAGRRVAIVTQGGGWGVLAADACHDAGLDVVELPEETIAELDTFMPGWWSRGNPIDMVAGMMDPSGPTRAADIALKCPVVDSIIFLGIGFGGMRGPRAEKGTDDPDKQVEDPAKAEERKQMSRYFREREAQVIDRLVEMKTTHGKPIMTASEAVLSAYGAKPNRSIQALEERGIRVTANVVNAAKTLARLAERYEFLQGTARTGTQLA